MQLKHLAITMTFQRTVTTPLTLCLSPRVHPSYIPHVLVLDAHGEPLYNQAGEVDSRIIEDLFKRSAEQ
jgi:hypothetical protein